LTPPIPTTEPAVVRAGDTWKWSKAVDGYTPADGWALKYDFHDVSSSAGTNTLLQFTAAANSNNTGWDITVLAATTAPLLSGNWKWRAYVEKGVEKYTVDVGMMFVEANLATAAAGSQLTQNERMLAAIQLVLSGRATNDIESYQIAGRAVNKIPITELVKLENIYIAKVKQERNPGKFGVIHEINFVRPGR
jgi:hypothetical protein